MSLLSPEPIHHWWEHYRRQPFWRLVDLFVARIFRGGGDSDAEGLDLGIGLVLTLLASPGAFVSVLLFDKYGSLLQWLRGQHNVDTLLMAFPDEYFFIVLSMTVTGAVAVWRWDAIFPDRRDYMNLVHLPISIRTIFFANLVAVLFLVGLLAADVNLASCILFPMVVSAAQSHFVFFLKFAAVHAVGVLLSSVFAYFAVFSMLGLLMAILPPQAFRRVSSYIRGVVVIYLVALLCTSFAVPDALRRSHGPAPAWTFLLPSTWFVALCQALRGRANPALMQLSRLALPGLGIIVVFAFCMYTVGYRRQFARIAEMADAANLARDPRKWHWTAALARVIFRTPFQRAGFRFVVKTVLRSETHRLVLTAAGGLGLVLASQALMNAFANTNSLRAAALSPEALSIPFILTFMIAVGLRVVFELPVELRANWIFQLMLDRDRQECGPLARKAILLLMLPLLLTMTFPVYLYAAGIVVACLHTLLVVTWAVLLADILLIRFRKLPFTCTLPVFKQHSIVILIAFCFGFLIYASSTPDFEAWALGQPWQMLRLLPVAAAAWYIPRHLARNTISLDRKLIFEDSVMRSFEMLRLEE